MNRPRKFLLTSLPTNDMGLVTRLLAIANLLRQNGHQVIFSHPAKVPTKIIRERGFDNEPPRHPLYEVAFNNLTISKIFSKDFKTRYGGLLPFITKIIRCYPYKIATPTTEVWNLSHALALTGFLNESFVNAHVETYKKVIEDTKPDAVIDAWNPMACIAARSLGVPLVTINQADAMPKDNGFIWWKKKPKDIPDVTPIFNRVLQKQHLKEVSNIEELNVGDLTLITGTPETDPLQLNFPYVHVGALFDKDIVGETPQWFSKLRNEIPVVWVYGGNLKYGGKGKIFDSKNMVTACCEALGKLEVQVVLSLGNHKHLPSDIDVPMNFEVIGFVPAMQMAKRANLMVHHGGYASCQVSLLSGTPSLILPTFSERESNARRLQALGTAEIVHRTYRDKDNYFFHPKDIAAKAYEIFKDMRYRDRTKAVGNQLRDFGGAEKAVDLIEKFMITRLTKFHDC